MSERKEIETNVEKGYVGMSNMYGSDTVYWLTTAGSIKAMEPVKTFITFGTDQSHTINGKSFDYATCACIIHPKGTDGRGFASALFGKEWCTDYTVDTIDQNLKVSVVKIDLSPVPEGDRFAAFFDVQPA